MLQIREPQPRPEYAGEFSGKGRHTAKRLVGTDLAQAVPLVIAAAAGHLLFGDVDWSVVLPLLVGSIPGAYFGARLSSRASAGLVRRALALVLLLVTAGLKMLGVSNLFTLVGFGGRAGWWDRRVDAGTHPLRAQGDKLAGSAGHGSQPGFV
ncbi:MULTISPECIES: sulfite exporter TauE/SafE family protein [Gordonia]|uniref:Probable membrane transporter protein n=1 Tax=Gordonia aquimaris TaxID=2984863 RepID=A0A9X3I307_9ACTN|nr:MULTISPECIES: sulfite exporter TauE/SafE family protein [Gordonia]MCX2963162.1 sulfite exporter TauE/SafE family protein [Gordonia aquimaris]